MPNAPEGYTHIEDATAKWGHHRTWWYDRVKEGPENGGLTGYKVPGNRGTYLRDDEVIAWLAPKPKEYGTSDGSSQVG